VYQQIISAIKVLTKNIIRMMKSVKMRWPWYVACIGEKRNAYRFLVRKPEGKRPLGR
jgi:hypothetical protein